MDLPHREARLGHHCLTTEGWGAIGEDSPRPRTWSCERRPLSFHYRRPPIETRAYQISFNPNWMSRPSWALVIVPLAALLMLLFGRPKFAWFKMLKNSARNCRRSRSVSVLFLIRLKSNALTPGLRLKDSKKTVEGEGDYFRFG
jgi:hypothetical protein